MIMSRRHYIADGGEVIPDGCVFLAPLGEGEEVSGECSGNSYSGLVSVPTLSSNGTFAYICNIRYTNKVYYSTLLPHGKYSCTYDGSVMNWYKDGVFAKSATWSIPTYNGSISIVQLHLNNYSYGMYIKDVRVYNRILSQQEINEL